MTVLADSRRRSAVSLILVSALLTSLASVAKAEPMDAGRMGRPSCVDLEEVRGLAGHQVKPIITSATLIPAEASVPEYCRVEGFVTTGNRNEGFNRVRFGINLPTAWNQRYVQLGDGGHDGSVSESTVYLDRGYATANSDMGHEGNVIFAAWAFNNRPAEIDYGYRAVHVTAVAAKSIIKKYYGQKPLFSYHVGLSTGGRQGAVAAQRYPRDFDGIAAGALFNNTIEIAMEQVWSSAVFFRDVDGDGVGFDNNITQADVDALRDAVLAECDVLGNDKIRDNVVDNPIQCAQVFTESDIEDFGAARGLTSGQIQAIKDVYAGPHDSTGQHQWYKGKALGSEYRFGAQVVPTPANGFFPGQLGFSKDFVNYLWFEHDPGLPTAQPNDPSLLPQEGEYRWLDFDFDKNTPKGGTTNPETGPWDPNDGGGFMRDLLNGSETDLTPFLIRNDAKYLLFHGWGDGLIPPEPTVDYWQGIVRDTFGSDAVAAGESVRLFMVPGMAHGGGGVTGAAVEWDELAHLADWVENGDAPDRIVVTQDSRTRTPEGNERIICPWPLQPTYVGPTIGNAQNDPVNWLASNFECRVQIG